LSVQREGIGLAVANGSADPELVSRVSRAQSLARDGLREARQAVSTLRGDVVPGTEQIPELVEEHRHGDPAACRFVEVGEPTALPADARLALYRTAQEALSNIRKHAPGADAVVELRWAPALVTLCVQDGGQKEAPVPAATGSTPGYGLKGLAERAALLGGSLEAGPSNDGFLVRLAVPLRREDGR
jgi:signal transduction histidine kinase